MASALPVTLPVSGCPRSVTRPGLLCRLRGFGLWLPGATGLLWQRPQPGRKVPIKQSLLISRDWGNSLCRESVAVCNTLGF